MKRCGIFLTLCAALAAPAMAQYCAASINNTCGSTAYEYMSNVTIDAINNSSGCVVTPAYSDYTALPPANLPVGVPTAISVTIGNIFASDVIFVWCDWDGSGTFDAAGLLGNELTTLSYPGSAVYTGSITPPVGSVVTTRMRLVLRWATTDSNPCPAGPTYGEIEDYTINVGGGGGPIPCTTSFSSPGGPGTVQIDNNPCPALAGAAYFWAFTLAAGTYPAGGWFGLDIGLAQLVNWFMAGYPFIGPLDGAGASTFSTGGLPSGLQVWEVTTMWAPGYGTFLLAYAPKTYTIP